MDIDAEKQLAGDHVEDIIKTGTGAIGLSQTAFFEAQQDALSEGLPRRKVIRTNIRLVLILILLQANGVILGIENILLGNLVGVQSFCRTMGYFDESTGEYTVRAGTLSLWAGVYAISQIIGNTTAGWVSDRFGRNKAIWLFVFMIYCGVATEIASQNKNDFTGAKILMGIGNGMIQVSIVTYVADVAPREIRGIAIGLFNMTNSIGNLICTLVVFGANQTWGANAFDNRGWRVPLYFGLATPTVTLVLMLIFMPESPYWLVMKNRVADAKKSLRRLHPGQNDEQIDRMAHLLQYTVYQEREDKESVKDASFMECFQGANLRRTFCAIFPALSAQFAGTQLINTYSTYFFEIAKLNNSLEASVIVYVVGIFAAALAFFLMDSKTIGRFPVLLSGVVGMTLSMLGIAIVDSVGNPTSTGSGAAFVLFLAICWASSMLGPGATGQAYSGESGSVRLRAKTATLSNCTNALIGGIFNIVIPYELDAIGPKTGYMFFGLGAISCVMVWLWVPEVTGRTYAQLDELFERRVAARKFKQTDCTGTYVPA